MKRDRWPELDQRSDARSFDHDLENIGKPATVQALGCRGAAQKLRPRLTGDDLRPRAGDGVVTFVNHNQIEAVAPGVETPNQCRDAGDLHIVVRWFRVGRDKSKRNAERIERSRDLFDDLEFCARE